MELNLTLTILKGNCLPINYQYQLSSWIYKVIQRADARYSAFLHEKGYVADGRSFKLFTFSQLDLRPYEISGNFIRLLGNQIYLNVRFHVDASLEHFIRGLFMEQRFGLGDRSYAVDFEVTSVETAVPMTFQKTMRYHCLSPVCISRLRRNDGSAEYLSPQDPDYGFLLVRNLQRKAHALVEAGGTKDVQLPAFDFKLLNTPRKKGIHIKANTVQHTQVIGYLFHFELTAPVELHEVGYYAGFGEKNSMGFGCVSEPG